MRTSAPHTTLPETLPEIKIEQRALSNGIPLHVVNAGTQDVVRVSLVFEAGTCYQAQKLVASATLALMSEGTQRLSAAQVAEALSAKGIEVDRKLIVVEPIKMVGDYEAAAKLHRDVRAVIKFTVTAEE